MAVASRAAVGALVSAARSRSSDVVGAGGLDSVAREYDAKVSGLAELNPTVAPLCCAVAKKLSGCRPSSRRC